MASQTQTAPLAPSPSSRVRWGGISLFLALAFGLSWAIWLGLGALGVGFTIRTAIGMFGPAVAAALVRGPLRHEGFADAGLRLVGRRQPRGGLMYVAAYLVPPLMIAAGIGLSLLIGYQHWTDPVSSLQRILTQTLAQSHRQLPARVSLPQLARITLITQVVAAFTIGLAINMIFTFGEEFGWRGYLLPRLAPLGGAWASVLTGIVWGLWHAPLIVLSGYNFPGHPWLGVGGMVLFTVALGVVFAWLRFRSGSVWPSTLAHAAVNAQNGFALLALAPAGNSLLRPPVGLIGVIPFAVLAVALIVTGNVRAERAAGDA
ncbi:MAG TPA: CPBP family intramembrane glutamic endopeptidase [Ktedonobacterales bacterium]|nr:CPBP family intramembrane glutamic endopeptidase [Ktedonobacterales bacterium]